MPINVLPKWTTEGADYLDKHGEEFRAEQGEAKYAELQTLLLAQDQALSEEYARYVTLKSESLKERDPNVPRMNQYMSAVKNAASQMDPYVREKLGADEEGLLQAGRMFKSLQSRFVENHGSADKARQQFPGPVESPQSGAMELAINSHDDFDTFYAQFDEVWSASPKGKNPDVDAMKIALEGTDFGTSLQYLSVDAVFNGQQGEGPRPTVGGDPIQRASDRLDGLLDDHPQFAEAINEKRDMANRYIAERRAYLNFSVQYGDIARQMVESGEAKDYKEADENLRSIHEELYRSLDGLRRMLPEAKLDVKLGRDRDLLWLPPSPGETRSGYRGGDGEARAQGNPSLNYSDEWTNAGFRAIQNHMSALALPLLDLLDKTATKEEIAGKQAAARPQHTDAEKRNFHGLIPATMDATMGDVAFLLTMAPGFTAGGGVAVVGGKAATKLLPGATAFLARHTLGRAAQTGARHATSFGLAEFGTPEDKSFGERVEGAKGGALAGAAIGSGGSLVAAGVKAAHGAVGKGIEKLVERRADHIPKDSPIIKDIIVRDAQVPTRAQRATDVAPKGAEFPTTLQAPGEAVAKVKTKADVEAAAKAFNKGVIEPEAAKVKGLKGGVDPPVVERSAKDALNELSETVKPIRPKDIRPATKAEVNALAEPKVLKGKKPGSLGGGAEGAFTASELPAGAEPNPIKRMAKLLKGTLKKKRTEQNLLNKSERKRQHDAIAKMGEQDPTEAGFLRQLEAASGAFKKVEYEPIRNQFTQAERNMMSKTIQNHPHLSTWERFRGKKALLNDILGGDSARIPEPGDLEILSRVFGEDIHKIVPGGPNWVQKVIGGYRAIRASDIASAHFRQGLPMLWYRPNIWAKNAVRSYRHFFSEKSYENVTERIVGQEAPHWMAEGNYYDAFKEGGLAMTSITKGGIAEREEDFMFSHFTEQLSRLNPKNRGLKVLAAPAVGVGHLVRASNRSYSGFLTELRYDVAVNLAERMQKAGHVMDKEAFRHISTFVNDFTGRGTLWKKVKSPSGKVSYVPKGTEAFNTATSIMFAPRFYLSAARILDPRTYLSGSSRFGGAGYNAFVRQEALYASLQMAAGTATVLGLADLAGLGVGWNPKSADFAKIKIGKTRIDVLRGLPQYMTFMVRLATGEVKSSVTGKLRSLEERGYKTDTRWDLTTQFILQKLAPLPSLVKSELEGEEFDGTRRTWFDRGLQLSPMFMEDMIDVYRTDPSLLPVSLLSQVGFGLNTYPMHTTAAMDAASRLVVEWQAAEEKPTKRMRQYEKAKTEYKRLLRADDSTQAEVDRARDKADRAAKKVVK